MCSEMSTCVRILYSFGYDYKDASIPFLIQCNIGNLITGYIHLLK